MSALGLNVADVVPMPAVLIRWNCYVGVWKLPLPKLHYGGCRLNFFSSWPSS